VSAINPAVRHCVPEFLKSIDAIRLGEREPEWIVERRRMMATSVVTFVVYGDQNDLDLGDMATSELAGATIGLCEKPQDQAAINAFVSARHRYREVQGSLGG
jgi:hypothetical protein